MEEINLRDYLEVLWRGKTIVVLVTVVAILTSGVLSFLVLPPVYEAKVMLMINLPQRQNGTTDQEGLKALLDSLSRYPQLSMETYRRQVLNPALLGRVIEKTGVGLTAEQLDDQIQVTVPKDSNLMEVVVSDNDPRRAANLANSLVQEYMAMVSQIAREQMTRSSQYIKEQMDVEEKKLGEALQDYKQVLQQPRSVSELQKELDSKITLLTQYKDELIKVSVESQALKGALEKTRSQLESQPKTLTTNKSLADDPVLQNLVAELAKTSPALVAGLKMSSEEVNPVFTDLSTLLATSNIEVAKLQAKETALRQAIAVTETQLETLRVDLAEKQIAQERLQDKVQTLKDTYSDFSKKYEETRIAESARIADTNLAIVAPATVPSRPVKPKKALNVAIAGVLGLMVGVFLVFIGEFWRNTAPSTQASSWKVSGTAGERPVGD